MQSNRKSGTTVESYDGARQIYGEITPAIQQRLDHELEIIARIGFDPSFLIAEDVLNFARQAVI